MHFNFDFTTVQVLWTLTFAALLVLLVVLMGRDRARLFPLFTASMALTALRLLASRMLYGRMAPITMSEIFLILACWRGWSRACGAVEMARRAFSPPPAAPGSLAHWFCSPAAQQSWPNGAPGRHGRLISAASTMAHAAADATGRAKD